MHRDCNMFIANNDFKSEKNGKFFAHPARQKHNNIFFSAWSSCSAVSLDKRLNNQFLCDFQLSQEPRSLWSSWKVFVVCVTGYDLVGCEGGVAPFVWPSVFRKINLFFEYYGQILSSWIIKCIPKFIFSLFLFWNYSGFHRYILFDLKPPTSRKNWYRK